MLQRISIEWEQRLTIGFANEITSALCQSSRIRSQIMRERVKRQLFIYTILLRNFRVKKKKQIGQLI